MTETLDRRLHAFRADLADIRLKGQVDAAVFIHGDPASLVVPVADLRPQPDWSAGIDTQLLLGENVRVFDRRDGFAWVQSDIDGYVGYLDEASLGPVTTGPTHRVIVPRTVLYPGADLRFPRAEVLSMGSRVTVAGEVETRGTCYAVLVDGRAAIAAHLMPLSALAEGDAVTWASLFLHTPYLWGGRSGFGMDCSGLVQMGLAMAGQDAPRDSDQQAASLGRELDPESEPLRRGDLVFWKGHVAFLEDEATIVHASGGTMTVTCEPLAAALARIAPLYGAPICYRRTL